MEKKNGMRTRGGRGGEGESEADATKTLLKTILWSEFHRGRESLRVPTGQK